MRIYVQFGSLPPIALDHNGEDFVGLQFKHHAEQQPAAGAVSGSFTMSGGADELLKWMGGQGPQPNIRGASMVPGVPKDALDAIERIRRNVHFSDTNERGFDLICSALHAITSQRDALLELWSAEA